MRDDKVNKQDEEKERAESAEAETETAAEPLKEDDDAVPETEAEERSADRNAEQAA